jgi:hypothetical protein
MRDFYPEEAGREVDSSFNPAQYEMFVLRDQPMETGARYALASHQALASAKDQCEIVRRHVGNFGQRKAGALCQLLDGRDIAHTPFGIAAAKVRIKRFVAVGYMPAIALERTVKKKQPAIAQAAPCAGNKSLGDGPRRDVHDIGAEHGEQFAARISPGVAPRRVRDVDAPRRTGSPAANARARLRCW